MAKFIEVHQSSQPLLVNIDMVRDVCFEEGKTMIDFDGDDSWITVDECYDQLRLMIGSAQGGIPMDQSKAY